MIIRKTAQHELEVIVNDTPYSPVRFIPVAPLSCGLDKSISVLNNDGQEIGWIDDLSSLEKDSAVLLTDTLEKQRPYQEINQILHVNSQHFPTSWTVMIEKNDQPLTITIEYAEELQSLPKGGVLITDKDRKIYILRQPDSLDATSKKKLKPFFVVQ